MLRAAEQDRPAVAAKRRQWRGWQRFMDPARFCAWVEQFLAPALAPGDGVVLDNLAVHKVDGVRQALAAAGAALLYLPPYSPDLNPIEQLFAKLQALLRKAGARTKDDLWSTIGRLLNARPPAECAAISVTAAMVPPKVKML